jgi:hypothetical protein
MNLELLLFVGSAIPMVTDRGGPQSRLIEQISPALTFWDSADLPRRAIS